MKSETKKNGVEHDKYFLDGEWLTTQEFINAFKEFIECNEKEMDASPDKSFYDSVRVTSGGERINEIVFDSSDSVENIYSQNLVFSAELINKVNEERPWTGGVVVAETDFTDESSLVYEIREMIKTIAAYHKHTFKNTSFGYVICAEKRKLNIAHDGLVGGYFSVEPFDGFDDYDFWINKVKTNSYGTLIADNIAFHRQRVLMVNFVKLKWYNSNII